MELMVKAEIYGHGTFYSLRFGGFGLFCLGPHPLLLRGYSCFVLRTPGNALGDHMRCWGFS